MAAVEELSPLQSGPFNLGCYDTALCVIPPALLRHDIDGLRSWYDKGHGKWPPHVNLVYPFVAVEQLHTVKDLLQSELGCLLRRPIFPVKLDACGVFSHKSNYTIYLHDSQSSEASTFANIRSNVLKLLGQHAVPYQFHLTIGQSKDKSSFAREFLLSKAKLLPTISVPITQLAILVREPLRSGAAGRMRLWGTVSLHSTATSPLSEFWLQPSGNQRSPNDSEDDYDHVEKLPEKRSAVPGVTYGFNPKTDSWTPAPAARDTGGKLSPITLSIATYNVLVDSEFPPSSDRYPLLIRSILSSSGIADILVLQEMSDEFFSYLLSDSQVRKLYPWASHGPPCQPDIGPLPNLRNIVILSNRHFTWSLLPFNRRHKGAIIAQFGRVRQSDGSQLPPLIVAGIHLTCGLTDGSVAAKKIQLQSLKNYLQEHFSSNSWVIAGDFNLTTSACTISTALKDGNISNETFKALSSIETMLTDAGLVDAWTAARIGGADHVLHETQSDAALDLYEGEYGATFDPRENPLAAATSGTSNNRPQRYDRILVRSESDLQVANFNHFASAEAINGRLQYASDHWGVRATLNVRDEETRTTPPEQLELLLQFPIAFKEAIESLSESSSLRALLNAQGMYPSQQEANARDEAFDLLRRTLTRPTEEQQIAADIPLVIVPVGSYALKVWTASSDIDCLCIGSISSKTFFRLARQRIRYAAAEGVRLVRKVEAATGTMFEISVGGFTIDLHYCPAARIVERWSEIPQLASDDPIFNLSMLSLRKLKPFRDLSYLQKTLPDAAAFNLAYRCIKLWAVQRGIYTAKYGYLGGVHITLMLSLICKRMAHQRGSVTATDMVATFFHHYAHFDFQANMVFDPFFHKKLSSYHRTSREPVVILGFHAPNSNVASNFTTPSLNTLKSELQLADQKLSTEGMTWERFLGDTDAGLHDFLTEFPNYVRVDLQYWGRSMGEARGIAGWLESRCLLLVVDIHKAVPNLNVRLWPARFTYSQNDEQASDLHGCYLLGLKTEPGLTREDRNSRKITLQAVLDRFQSQMQTDDKHYSPVSTWIDVKVVKPSEIARLGLDTKDWGEDQEDDLVDSDDEEPESEFEGALEELYVTTAGRKTPGPTSTSQPVSTNKLRPASDVLNRLRWDPNLEPGDYLIGYEDRFLGARETSLEKWKTDQTDDEFIPQHRILYFKRRSDGQCVWERKSRVDLVFGSGASAA